jgi:hypothetical protein
LIPVRKLYVKKKPDIQIVLGAPLSIQSCINLRR